LTDTDTEWSKDVLFPNERAVLGEPIPLLKTVFERQIIPALTGIYDQCGIRFALGTVKAVRPNQLRLRSGQTLAQAFATVSGERVFLTEAMGARLLREAVEALTQELAQQGIVMGKEDRNMFLLGLRQREGDQIYSGFGWVSGFANLIRWRAFLLTDPQRDEIFCRSR